MAKKIKKAAPPKKRLPSALIDLQKQLLIEVDGEEQKDNTIKWDLLRSIGDAAQNLVKELARNAEGDKILTPESLKLEFVGFHKASAVPEFLIADDHQYLFDAKPVYKRLNADLSVVLKESSAGNFQAIADRYKDPVAKNSVVTAVYNFTNSAGKAPMYVVKPAPAGSKERYKKIAVIRPMKREVKEKLYVEPPPDAIQKILAQEEDAVANIRVKKSATGRTLKKVMQFYQDKEASLSLKFDSIEVGNRLYTLTGEIAFDFAPGKKKSVSIENAMLDIYAFGNTMAEAKEEMYAQFDYTYRRLNEFKDEELSDHLRNAKTYINLIVASVKGE